MNQILKRSLPFVVALLLFGCSAGAPEANQTESPAIDAVETEPVAMEAPAATQAQAGEFAVTSSGIVGGVIDDSFGMRGDQATESGIPNRSFALSFQNIPAGCACLALCMIDPDGGDWVHWLAANVPAADLPENASVDLASSIVQGQNSFGFIGYGGPTPPSGTHTYVITVYALSEALALEDGFSLSAFEEAIDGVVLDSAGLTGTYSH